jgi:hypothetical protein
LKKNSPRRSKASTETAAFSLLNTILVSLDKNNKVGGLFLDLRKAFDCVNHDTLLSKLNFYGVSGKANKLLKFYITDRYQTVVIRDKFSNKITSEWTRIKHGVPQGSVLGPSLFHIYVNDLPRTIDNFANSILFAQEFKHNIDVVLHEITNWFLSNLLTPNYNKTHFLQLLVKQQNEINIQIITTNLILTNINSTKFLGLTIDCTLSWREHIAALTPKLNKACFATRTIKPFMTLKVLKMVYFSYFLQLCLTASFLGVHLISVTIYLKYKRD